MGYSISILNNIRDNASSDYQARVPVATQETITAVGNALASYTVLYNEFCDALFNKIGKTLIEGKLFKNKLARFKSGAVLSQQDVEEIFIDMAKAATAYDPDGKNPLGRRTDDNVQVAYHRMNRQDCYEITIGDIDFRRVFSSEASLDAFIKGRINAVYSRAAHDEWIYMKNTLATFDGYFDYDVSAIGAGTNTTRDALKLAAEGFVKTVKKAVQDVSFASTSYNKAGVMTWSEPGNLVLLVNKDVLAEIDVDVLARAINPEKVDAPVSVIAMDDFGSLDDTYGLLIDAEFLRVWDTLSHMEPQRNAQGLFTNYFYHVHQILSASPFKTAVRFKVAA